MISVIIPVYNVEHYLARTLDCVLGQTYKDIEVLLINDGSTDNTLNICNEYAQADHRVRVYHQENAGVSAARNVGIQLATGKYISFVDGDDTLDKDFFEKLMLAAEKYELDISCCGIVQHRLDGSVHTYADNSFAIIEIPELISGFFTNRIYKEVLYGPCNKLIRADIVKNTLFNPQFRMGEDLLFSFECMEKAKSFALLNEDMYHYEKRENSATTSKFSEKEFHYIRVADILLEKCRMQYPFAYANALQWTYQHKLVMCRRLLQNMDIRKKNIAFYAECWQFVKENRSICFAKLPFKRKLDYYLCKFTPWVYRWLLK